MSGEPSIAARAADAGVPVAIGFQGQPVTSSVASLVGELVSELRALGGEPGFDSVEQAVHRVRTRSDDLHRAELKMVVYCAPHLTAGRGRWESTALGHDEAIGSLDLTAFRTAGQLLVTKLADGRTVRIPLPVDPLTFSLTIHERAIRVTHELSGLRPLLEDMVRVWPALGDRAVEFLGKTVDRGWGLLSAMFDAVVEGCERLVGEARPIELDREIQAARARDWGSPAGLALIDVDTGETLCSLGAPPADLVVKGSPRFAPRNDQPELRRLRVHPPVQQLTNVDWDLVNHAAGGDHRALRDLIRIQRTTLLSLNSSYRESLSDTSPHGMAIPAVTDLLD
jgi:hypothetical protein